VFVHVRFLLALKCVRLWRGLMTGISIKCGDAMSLIIRNEIMKKPPARGSATGGLEKAGRQSHGGKDHGPVGGKTLIEPGLRRGEVGSLPQADRFRSQQGIMMREPPPVSRLHSCVTGGWNKG
jgi:hypothetical protein